MQRTWLMGVAIAALVSRGALATESGTCRGDVTIDDTKTTSCKVIEGDLIIRGTRTPNLESVVEVQGDIDLMLQPTHVSDGKLTSSGFQANAPAPAALKMPNLKRAGSILITYAGVSSVSFPQLESVEWIWFHDLALKTVDPFGKLAKAGRIQIINTSGADSAFAALTEAAILEYSGRIGIKPVLPKLTSVTESLSLATIDGGNFPALANVRELRAHDIVKLRLPQLKKVRTLRINAGARSGITAGPVGVEGLEEVSDLLELRDSSWISTKDKGLRSLKKVGTLALEDSGCGMPPDQIRAISLDLLKIDVGGACWKLIGPSLRKRAKKTIQYNPDAWMSR